MLFFHKYLLSIYRLGKSLLVAEYLRLSGITMLLAGLATAALGPFTK
jgi:hypothetical protein